MAAESLRAVNADARYGWPPECVHGLLSVSAVAADRNGETASEILRPFPRQPVRLIAQAFRVSREDYNIERLDSTIVQS